MPKISVCVPGAQPDDRDRNQEQADEQGTDIGKLLDFAGLGDRRTSMLAAIKPTALMASANRKPSATIRLGLCLSAR
jgi:hypothetical protein